MVDEKPIVKFGRFAVIPRDPVAPPTVKFSARRHEPNTETTSPPQVKYSRGLLTDEKVAGLSPFRPEIEKAIAASERQLDAWTGTDSPALTALRFIRFAAVNGSHYPSAARFGSRQSTQPVRTKDGESVQEIVATYIQKFGDSTDLMKQWVTETNKASSFSPPPTVAPR